MLDGEILILKVPAVDGSTASAIAFCEVSALDHKILDDAMKRRALVTGFRALGGKLVEVSSRLWDLVAVQTYENAAERLLSLLDIEEDPLCDGHVSHGEE